MQFRQKLSYIALDCMILLSGVVLLINVPAQAPKQAQVAFHSDRDGNMEIHVMDANGRNPRRLTNNPAEDRSPDWFDPAFARISTSVSPAGRLKGTWGWLKQTSK